MLRNEKPTHPNSSQLFATHGLQPARFLRLWNSTGKNTGVSSPSLLQRIFLTHRSNLGLLAGHWPPGCRQILYCLSHRGSLRSLCRVSTSVVIFTELHSPTTQEQPVLLHVLSHLIFKITLRNRCYHHPHFIDKGSEAQRK